MNIPILEHVIEAVQTAVRQYPCGVKAMAAKMDMAPSSLGNALNPYADRSSVKLGLEQAAYIMKETGDATALCLLASELGYALIPLNAQPDKDIKGEQLDNLQALASWQKAIADNASREEQERCFGRLMLDIMETATAVKASR